MNPENLIINPAKEGATEVIIREGKAPDILPVVAPRKVEIVGTLPCVLEYLNKRVSTGQFNQEDSHIIVDRSNLLLKLIFNERDEYNHGSVLGALQFHDDFKSLHINDGYEWTPTELAILFKMHRYWFSDRKVCMEIVTTLMNFTADVQQKVEQAVNERGGRKDNFEQVVNSNLPASVTMSLPICKGYANEQLEVEFFAKVNGREVSFVLLSPGVNESVESIRNSAIDAQLNAIKEVAPKIALIEV